MGNYAIRVAFDDVPLAAKIWALLLTIALVALVSLASLDHRAMPAVRGRRCLRLRRSGAARRGCATTFDGAEPAEELRYAEEITVAARRAADTAERSHQQWAAAQSAVEVAWHAYEQADAALRRSAEAAAYRLPNTPQTPAEYADRERHLHRVVRGAYERGELSLAQMQSALAHRNGFDPRLHPVQVELVLHRAVRDHLLHTYRMASRAERTSWQAADLAAAAATSLRQEAFRAVELVRDVRQPRPLLPALPTAVVRLRPRLATHRFVA